MSNPPKRIDVNEPLTPQAVTTIVVPEDVRQELSTVRCDTWHCMWEIHNLRQDFERYAKNCHIPSTEWLEARVSHLEDLVWKLLSYIEEGVDVR